MSDSDAAGGGLITWVHQFAAKKSPTPTPRAAAAPGLDISDEKWSASSMIERDFSVSRRRLLTSLAGAGLAAAGPSITSAQSPKRPERAPSALTLQARSESATLQPGGSPSPIWALRLMPSEAELRFTRGDQLAVSFDNALPIPIVLAWRGMAAPPRAVAPGSRDQFAIPLKHAGTFLCDTRALGDAQARPSPARAVVVQESEPVEVDIDQILLIEDWRLSADGTAAAPGAPSDATALYTVNGLPAIEIVARANARLRIRFINACQRTVIAVRIEDHALTVMAIDGQPAEPFLARNSQIVLAPGTRLDAFVDATRPPGSAAAILLHDGKQPQSFARLLTSTEPPLRDAPRAAASPLPSNGLPAQLDLKSALRVELALDKAPDWLAPADWAVGSPMFKVKRNRPVVLALTNRGGGPMVFHLQGHHFRLLDRLDDGWKPFWLDTLVVDPGQTHRIAFRPETAGSWLMETMATDWAAPRRIRSFAVE